MSLSNIYNNTVKKMQAELAEIRDGFDHSGVRGGEVEEIVRDFLRRSLPRSLGVTVGQVVDSDGTYSGQSDVIVYSALRTPMLLRGRGGSHCVPAEGVVAVIEVKSKLQKKDLPQIREHASRLKRLKRTCYLPQAISTHRELYDQTWEVIPPLYSVFAFESDGLYVEELNDAQLDQPLHERVDNLCALDRGFAVNVCVTGDIADPENVLSYQPTATTHSTLAEAEVSNPLLLWHLMNSTLWNQFDCPPIQLVDYFHEHMKFAVTAPQDKNRTLASELERKMADHIGMDVEKMRQMVGQSGGDGVSVKEMVDHTPLVASGNIVLKYPHLTRIISSVAHLAPEDRMAAVHIELVELIEKGIDPMAMEEDSDAEHQPGGGE